MYHTLLNIKNSDLRASLIQMNTSNGHETLETIPLIEWILRHSLLIPNRAAVKDRFGNTLTYRELETKSNQLANALRGLGLQTGQAFLTWMNDDIINIVAFLAAAKAGLIVVPVSERLQAPEVEFIIGEMDPRVILFSDSVFEQLSRCMESGTLDGQILLAAGSRPVKGSLRVSDVINGASPTAEPRFHLGSEQPFLIAFSSGTTGRPKGAVLTGSSIREIAIISSMSRRLGFYSTGVSSGSLSFPSTIMATVFTHLYMGSCIVLMGRGWDVDELLTVVEREHAAYVNVLAPHFRDFAHAATQRPATLLSLTSVVHGGSRVPTNEIALLYEVVGSRLVEVWGMVEHSGGPLTATTQIDYGPTSETRNILDSVGRSVPQCSVEIIDANGAPLPHDGSSIGELVVKSPALMRGYWGRPSDTAEVLHDGHYHTGDLGSIDPEGFVYIADRRDDLIVSGGANIYPSEIERLLMECPLVHEVTVIGIPHEKWGRTPVAIVITKEGSGLSEADVVSFLDSRLASYKKPTRIVVSAKSLPRNVSGKIARKLVESIYLDSPSALLGPH